MEELYHLTTVYVSALLTAILPQISKVSANLDLPIAVPVTIEHIETFIPNSTGKLEGSLFFDDHSWFHFDRRGFVDSYMASTNWFNIQNIDEIPFYYGKSTISTNQIIEFARESISKLGYTIDTINQKPIIEGPFDLKNGNHVPYCRVEWNVKNKKGTSVISSARVDVDTQNKRVVGFNFNTYYSDPCLFGFPIQIDVAVDTRDYFLQRTFGTRTNTPTLATENFVKMTSEYSDELLTHILPRISDYILKLGIPCNEPLKKSDVKFFTPNLNKRQNGGIVELKNGYSFDFDSSGFISFFMAPGWFKDQNLGEEPIQYLGRVMMTTNEICNLARETIHSLGYPVEQIFIEKTPDLKWAYKGNGEYEYSDGEIPYCTLCWSDNSLLGDLAIVGVNARDCKIEQIQVNPALFKFISKSELHPIKIDTKLDSLFLHITPNYSNALLKCILPRVSDFAQKLGLLGKLPITIDQVQQFYPSHVRGEIAGSIRLKNGFWFEFDKAGYVCSFRSPDNYFFAEPDHKNFLKWSPKIIREQDRFIGNNLMSTNQIILLAREVVRKLGYDIEKLQLDRQPKLQGPYEFYNDKCVPYCRVIWKSKKNSDLEKDNTIHVEINTQKQEIVGFYLQLSELNKKNMVNHLKINIVPEGLPEFLERIK